MAGRKKILIIDDETDSLKFFAKFLKKRGYEVFTAECGEDGLTEAQKEIPHLIIIDLMLPDMNGSDVAAKIMDIPLLREAKIMFITGTLTDAEGGKIDLIADRYVLTKPCDLDKVLEIIHKLIGEAKD